MGLFNFFGKGNPPGAVSRKKRNDILLREQGLPVNQWLPMLGEESETRFREAPEIVTRALILSYLS